MSWSVIPDRMLKPKYEMSLQKIAPTLDLPSSDLNRRLHFETDTARAVQDADVVQENGPERLPFKQELWAKIEKASPQALLLSSSSSLTASQQAALMKHPGRLLIGHPFNPPHLIPLVEVVPGEKTNPKAIEDAVAFYSALGKVAKVIHKEIRSFVANWLQGTSGNAFISSKRASFQSTNWTTS